MMPNEKTSRFFFITYVLFLITVLGGVLYYFVLRDPLHQRQVISHKWAFMQRHALPSARLIKTIDATQLFGQLAPIVQKAHLTLEGFQVNKKEGDKASQSIELTLNGTFSQLADFLDIVFNSLPDMAITGLSLFALPPSSPSSQPQISIRAQLVAL